MVDLDELVARSLLQPGIDPLAVPVLAEFQEIGDLVETGAESLGGLDDPQHRDHVRGVEPMTAGAAVRRGKQARRS